jgi:retron-type reverse transcriptase
LRKYDYVLKCDIRKYFPSIDHEILKKLIRKKISDKDTLWLIDRIIDGSNLQDTVVDYYPGDDLLTPSQRRKGLPIGNLTSQFFANFYLNPLDHFIKEILRCPAYLRYVDDFALFSDSKEQLTVWKEDSARFLEKYRLRLHSRRCHIILSRTGSRFLGQVIFRSHRRLCGENVRRFKKRLRKWQHHPPENFEQRINSWVGHARQADTAALLKALAKVHKTPT